MPTGFEDILREVLRQEEANERFIGSQLPMGFGGTLAGLGQALAGIGSIKLAIKKKKLMEEGAEIARKNEDLNVDKQELGLKLTNSQIDKNLEITRQFREEYDRSKGLSDLTQIMRSGGDTSQFSEDFYKNIGVPIKNEDPIMDEQGNIYGYKTRKPYNVGEYLADDVSRIPTHLRSGLSELFSRPAATENLDEARKTIKEIRTLQSAERRDITAPPSRIKEVNYAKQLTDLQKGMALDLQTLIPQFSTQPVDPIVMESALASYNSKIFAARGILTQMGAPNEEINAFQPRTINDFKGATPDKETTLLKDIGSGFSKMFQWATKAKKNKDLEDSKDPSSAPMNKNKEAPPALESPVTSGAKIGKGEREPNEGEMAMSYFTKLVKQDGMEKEKAYELAKKKYPRAFQ